MMILIPEPIRIGYSLLLGHKYEFYNSIINKESYIGLEYFHASKYWVSHTSDTNSVGNFSWGLLGNTIKTYIGVSITPKINLGLFNQFESINYAKYRGGNRVYSINDKTNKTYLRLDILF